MKSSIGVWDDQLHAIFYYAQIPPGNFLDSYEEINELIDQYSKRTSCLSEWKLKLRPSVDVMWESDVSVLGLEGLQGKKSSVHVRFCGSSRGVALSCCESTLTGVVPCDLN